MILSLKAEMEMHASKVLEFINASEDPKVEATQKKPDEPATPENTVFTAKI